MFIEQIKEASKNNSRVSGTFIINNCEAKPFKQKSGSFVQCDLTDRTGTIKGIIWEDAERILSTIKNKTVVKISGEGARYNDVPQLIIKTVTPADSYEKSDIIPVQDPEKRKETVKLLKSTAKEMNDPYRILWDVILDGDISEKFLECPGGVGDVHHAYLGGLAEHSANLVWAAMWYIQCPGMFSCNQYDKELLLTGCLVHDIGKIGTYNWDPVIEMSDTGRLLHHVPIGYSILMDIFDKYFDTHNDRIALVRDLLLHIIVTHHEEEDKGHRVPMFPEASIVARLDSLDAVANQSTAFILDHANTESNSNWTRFCQLTQRRYYLLKKMEPKIQETPKIKKDDNNDGIF